MRPLHFLLYKPIVTALRKNGYVATLENEARQKHTGLLILASFIIVTCVLIILSMNRDYMRIEMKENPNAPIYTLTGTVIHGRVLESMWGHLPRT